MQVISWGQMAAANTSGLFRSLQCLCPLLVRLQKVVLMFCFLIQAVLLSKGGLSLQIFQSFENKQGKKVCKTTVVKSYQCFSLHLLLFFCAQSKLVGEDKKATSVSC